MVFAFSVEREWLRENIENHDVQQTKNIAPFITRKTSFGLQIRELVFGVNIFDLDCGVQVDSVKQSIQRDSVGSGHVSHRWTSSFDDHIFLTASLSSKMHNCASH